MKPQPTPIDLDEVAREFRPKISFKVRRALGGRNPDWEDVTNEILAQAVEKIRSGEFRGDSAVGTFIYIITVRRIADYFRKKTKILKFAPEPGIPAEPGEDAERSEDVERMIAALGTLKPKYKDVLRLYFLMELTREETAQRLGISPAAVSERVNYAQKLLRKKLKR
jgi:RNA polymerase sigma-70 factor (ECF subfamily)